MTTEFTIIKLGLVSCTFVFSFHFSHLFSSCFIKTWDRDEMKIFTKRKWPFISGSWRSIFLNAQRVCPKRTYGRA